MLPSIPHVYLIVWGGMSTAKLDGEPWPDLLLGSVTGNMYCLYETVNSLKTIQLF